LTNHRTLADVVRHFLYYGEFLAEYTYEDAIDLPIAISEGLLWQAGKHSYRVVAPGMLPNTVPESLLLPAMQMRGAFLFRARDGSDRRLLRAHSKNAGMPIG
jgi:hypothetical protein